MAISILALANTGGRIFWGWVSDKIGRFNTVVVMFVLGGIAMLVLPAISGLFAFVMVLIVVGLCFGGFMGIFPSITADAFGPKNLGMNYGVMFTAFGFAAFVGPRLAATVKEVHHGDYTYAFLIAAALSLLGIVLTLSLVFTNAADEKKKALRNALSRKASDVERKRSNSSRSRVVTHFLRRYNDSAMDLRGSDSTGG